MGKPGVCYDRCQFQQTGGRRSVWTSPLVSPGPPRGHDNILVVVDRLSKWAYFIPTQTTIDAKGTAELFHDVVFVRHGMPKRIVSDRDSKFTSSFWDAFITFMGTTLGMSTSYHPQTDGQTERVNRVLNEGVAKLRGRDAN